MAAHEFDFLAKDPEPVAAATTAPTAAEPEEAKESSKPSGLRMTGYVTAGVGVAALGGGLITGILSQNKKNDAEDKCIENICEESTSEDFDSAKSMATVANILFISGGVLAATGVTLIVLGGDKSSETGSTSPSLAITPAPSPGGAALFATGRF